LVFVRPSVRPFYTATGDASRSKFFLPLQVCNAILLQRTVADDAGHVVCPYISVVTCITNYALGSL